MNRWYESHLTYWKYFSKEYHNLQAIGLYLNTSLADGSKIHANASDFSCSNLAQVWTLERSRTKKPNLNALI